MRFSIRRGLTLSLTGEPENGPAPAGPVASVALLGADYHGLRPRVLVQPGDTVALGQPLVEDRQRSWLRLTSPASGRIAAVERGERRELRAVVVRIGDERESAAFPVPTGGARTRDAVVDLLTKTGLWAALRVRPFGGIADPARRDVPLYVTAIETDPLAADPVRVLAQDRDAFVEGVDVLARLGNEPVHVCKAQGADVPVDPSGGAQVVEFSGRHPAGLAGTHMHVVTRVSLERPAWHIGYQDVIAIGKLFTSGRIAVERVVSLAGPMVLRPRLVRTRLGAAIDDLVREELRDGPCRVVSGSVLSGRQASGWGRHLGRYHGQVCALSDPRDAGVADGAWMPWSTARRGRATVLIPSAEFERVWPFDVPPVPLLRALVVGDAAGARDLGCLEFEEEDLALCSYVCPGKQNYGAALRRILDAIERRP